MAHDHRLLAISGEFNLVKQWFKIMALEEQRRLKCSRRVLKKNNSVFTGRILLDQLRLLLPCQVCIRNSVAQTGYQDSRKASDWLYNFHQKFLNVKRLSLRENCSEEAMSYYKKLKRLINQLKESKNFFSLFISLWQSRYQSPHYPCPAVTRALGTRLSFSTLGLLLQP